MERTMAAIAAAALASAAMPAATQPVPSVAGLRPAPYWASIAAGEARMRTGPARTFPASWVYRRAGLPVRVIAVYPGWRKVRDPDGTEGWMIANLLSAQRTAYVRTAGALRAAAGANAAIAWQVAPGVSARIVACANGWCRIEAGARSGYIEAADLWGVDPGETVE